MFSLRDKLTSWKTGTTDREPVMYLTTEKNGVIALRLTPDMARDLGYALWLTWFGHDRLQKSLARMRKRA